MPTFKKKSSQLSDSLSPHLPTFKGPQHPEHRTQDITRVVRLHADKLPPPATGLRPGAQTGRPRARGAPPPPGQQPEEGHGPPAKRKSGDRRRQTPPAPTGAPSRRSAPLLGGGLSVAAGALEGSEGPSVPKRPQLRTGSSLPPRELQFPVPTVTPPRPGTASGSKTTGLHACGHTGLAALA